MKKRSIKYAALFALSCLALVGFGCTKKPLEIPPVPTNQVNFDSAFTLQTGSAVIFKDGLTLTLEKINDSRCKKDVVCVWAGELSPQLKVSGRNLAQEQEINLGTVNKMENTVEPYTFTLKTATETSAELTVKKMEAPVK